MYLSVFLQSIFPVHLTHQTVSLFGFRFPLGFFVTSLLFCVRSTVCSPVDHEKFCRVPVSCLSCALPPFFPRGFVHSADFFVLPSSPISCSPLLLQRETTFFLVSVPLLPLCSPVLKFTRVCICEFSFVSAPIFLLVWQRFSFAPPPPLASFSITNTPKDPTSLFFFFDSPFILCLPGDLFCLPPYLLLILSVFGWTENGRLIFFVFSFLF